MNSEIEWEYKGFECKVWFTSRADVKWSAVNDSGKDSEFQTGLVVTTDQEKTKGKLESGVEKVEELIDDDFSHRKRARTPWKS